MNSSCILSPYEQELIEKLNIFKIQGTDKRGHKILRVIGNLFPARLVSVEALNKYLKEKVFPNFDDDEQKKPFSVVYLHTGVRRCENFPGILAFRSICNAIPVNVKDNLQTIYYVHPGLQSRLFLATFGRLIFTGGRLYSKVKYVSRLEFLWGHIKRKEIEIPEFVSDHEEELDLYHHPHPFIDYDLESDHPRGLVYAAAAMDLESDHPRGLVYAAAAMDFPVSTFSMRCIA